MILDYASEHSRRPLTKLPAWLVPSPGFWASLAGAVSCGLAGYLWPTTTLFCVPLAFGAVIIPVIDWALRRLVTGRRLWVARVSILAVVTVLMTAEFTWSGAETFRRAFSIDPPDGITQITANATGAGPGDVVAFLRFKASRAALDRIVAARGLELRRDDMRDLATGTMTWRQVADPFDRFIPRAQFPPAIAAPEIYRWDRSLQAAESLYMIYDPATGEAYVLYLFG